MRLTTVTQSVCIKCGYSHVTNHHCVKSVQIRSFFWSAFSRIRTEYGEILRIFPYSVQIRENMDQKKLRIWTHFTQCMLSWLLQLLVKDWHCVKIVRIWSFSGPYFPTFGLKTERCVSLCFQSECGRWRTRKTPNTDTFHAVWFIHLSFNFVRMLPIYLRLNLL